MGKILVPRPTRPYVALSDAWRRDLNEGRLLPLPKNGSSRDVGLWSTTRGFWLVKLRATLFVYAIKGFVYAIKGLRYATADPVVAQTSGNDPVMQVYCV